MEHAIYEYERLTKRNEAMKNLKVPKIKPVVFSYTDYRVYLGDMYSYRDTLGKTYPIKAWVDAR
jgi:hypothetical protein